MRLPFTSCTITVTRGSRTSGDSLSCTLFSSCAGVRPSAGTSPKRGSVIFPSGLTGTVRDRSGSFQTETSTTSSLASRYSCTTCCASSCWDTPLCAQPGPNASSAAAGPHHHLQLTDIECLLRHGRTGGSRAGPGARRVPDRRALREAHCVFPATGRGRAARRFCASRPVALRCVPHEWKRRSHSRGTGGSGDALARILLSSCAWSTSHRARVHGDAGAHAPHHRRRRHRVRRRRLRAAEGIAGPLRGAAAAPLDGHALPSLRQAPRAAHLAQAATSRARPRADASSLAPPRSPPLAGQKAERGDAETRRSISVLRFRRGHPIVRANQTLRVSAPPRSALSPFATPQGQELLRERSLAARPTVGRSGMLAVMRGSVRPQSLIL